MLAAELQAVLVTNLEFNYSLDGPLVILPLPAGHGFP